MTEELEHQRDRIQKLLAKAASTNSTEEAEAFAAKASELMLRFAIDEASLRSAGETHAEPIVRDYELVVTFWPHNFQILMAIADAFDVRVLFTPYRVGRKPYAHFVGFEEDVTSTIELYESLFTHLMLSKRSAVKEWKAVGPRTRAERTQFEKSYRLGFASKIREWLAETRRTVVHDVDTETGGSLLPVLAAKDAQVESAKDAAFPNSRTTRSRSQLIDAAGFVAGVEVGKTADVGATAIPE